MATININEIHPHAGAIWQRVLSIWVTYVPNETWAFTSTLSAVTIGSQDVVLVTITVDDGTDVTNYNMAQADTPYISGSGRIPLEYMGNRPGFADMPPVIQSQYGARDAYADFEATAWLAKKRMIVASTGFDYVGQTDAYNVNFFPSISARTFVAIYNSGYGQWVSVQSISFNHNDPTYAPYEERPTYQPNMLAQSGVASSGGGSIDIAPVVAALNEIAMIDVTYSANNGATTFSMRGKVRTGS